MNSSKLIWAVGLSFGGVGVVNAAPDAQPSAYEQAVLSYLEAAENELAAIGKQVNEVIPDEKETAPTNVAKTPPEVETLIEEWDELLQRWSDLSKAKPTKFDLAKQAYEEQRGVVREALNKATAAS